MPMENEAEKKVISSKTLLSKEKSLRAKCKRWVGSIMRSDRHTWTLLLSANFSWFHYKIKQRAKREEIDWKECVDIATEDELKKLFKEIEEYRVEQWRARG